MGSEPRVDPTTSYFPKFKLYQTPSNFYMIGRDDKKTVWRVLKIDRTEPGELNIYEDPGLYTKAECRNLRRRLHAGNRQNGGLIFVAYCYGIVGFIKFLEPYYMLVITKRKKLGAIGSHIVYGIAKSEMILIPHPSVQSKVAYSQDENRYKKLLRMVDLRKDFYFSYSYHVMYSLQDNLLNIVARDLHYETAFVWNGFLTQGIRNTLMNTIWTIALVYGFFKQVKLSTSGRDFILTLIARRSRHYAGTRYMRRGVNEKGRVANDVETEQIVFEDVPPGCRMQISSVLQNRGSIPVYWSQETSLFNPQPEIKLSKKEPNYDATRLHFRNLLERYGQPIIILNLIKASEKKRNESILRTEFAKAILFINKNKPKERRLRAIHFDLSKYHKIDATGAFKLLCRFATIALEATGILFCQVSADLKSEVLLNESCFEEKNNTYSELTNGDSNASRNHHEKVPMLQSGVLRTNCIDCLDRTNYAQYAFGLVALGHQLHSLGFMESPDISLDNLLAIDLMEVYQTMGDTLALQYGGSAAHNKMFAELKGHWNAANKSQEILTSLYRHYSNAYLDGEKQNAINMFLGHFQPQQGKPALWRLDSDQHYDIGRHSGFFDTENSRFTMKRSLSESILCESDSTTEVPAVKSVEHLSEMLNRGISESNPAFPTFEAGVSDSRQRVFEIGCPSDDEDGSPCNFTNLDLHRFSSSVILFEDNMYERSVYRKSSAITFSDMETESITSASDTDSTTGEIGRWLYPGDVNSARYSSQFVQWVGNGWGLF